MLIYLNRYHGPLTDRPVARPCSRAGWHREKILEKDLAPFPLVLNHVKPLSSWLTHLLSTYYMPHIFQRWKYSNEQERLGHASYRPASSVVYSGGGGGWGGNKYLNSWLKETSTKTKNKIKFKKARWRVRRKRDSLEWLARESLPKEVASEWRPPLTVPARGGIASQRLTLKLYTLLSYCDYHAVRAGYDGCGLSLIR